MNSKITWNEKKNERRHIWKLFKGDEFGIWKLSKASLMGDELVEITWNQKKDDGTFQSIIDGWWIWKNYVKSKDDKDKSGTHLDGKVAKVGIT